jgi:hypothetical protein
MLESEQVAVVGGRRFAGRVLRRAPDFSFFLLIPHTNFPLDAPYLEMSWAETSPAAGCFSKLLF